MDPDWKNTIGKLLAGGCGTQLGMLFTCGSVVVTTMLCVFCAASTVLAVQVANLGRQVAPLEVETVAVLDSPAESPVPASHQAAAPPPVETPVSEPAPPPPSPTPVAETLPPLGSTSNEATSRPIVTARDGGVNLRLGPGTDYDTAGLLPDGESLEIVGRNDDSTWWLVSAPGGLAWVADGAVTARNVGPGIPVVGLPPPLFRTTPAPATVEPTATPRSVSAAGPPPVPPDGTPTAAASRGRRSVEDTPGYANITARLKAPAASTSFSPDGEWIAVIDSLVLQTVATEGTPGQVWLETDDLLTLVGGAVWSPDGAYLAFTVDLKQFCDPCRAVALVKMADASLTFLTPPLGFATDAPRWTQDGRVLVNVHPGNPAQGTPYIYDTKGQGEPAAGTYLLSASHDGQQWLPWQPGREWRVGAGGRPDSYYTD